MKRRVDLELVKREIFKTRNKASEAVSSGIVFCNDKKVEKASFLVCEDDNLEVRGYVMPYVSRGGLKLEKAVLEFNISLKDKTMIDIGSSTGGFTDFALKNGIKKVIAVDVGKDQMHESLKKDSRVLLYEKTDFRNLDINLINDVDIAVIDVSFISLSKLVYRLSQMSSLKEIICLIKPQFECGKEVADKYKGVILDKEIHKNVIKDIFGSFADYNFFACGLTYSPITGGDGNIEYLAYFKKQKSNSVIDIEKVVNEVFNVFKI